MENNQVKTPQPEPVNQPPQVNAPRKSSALVMVIGGIVLLGLGLLGGYFLFGNKSQLSNQDTQAVVQVSPTTAPEPTKSNESADASSNMKTYTSSSAAFSILYPTNWNLVNVPPDDSYADDIAIGPGVTTATEDPNTKVLIQVQKINKSSSIKNASDYINATLNGNKSSPDYVNGKISQTSVNGNPAWQLQMTYKTAKPLQTQVAIDHNNLIYMISGNSTTQEFNTILSTFKFTK